MEQCWPGVRDETGLQWGGVVGRCVMTWSGAPGGSGIGDGEEDEVLEDTDTPVGDSGSECGRGSCTSDCRVHDSQ